MRLVLIEDNKRLAELTCEGLTGAGFAVDHFETLKAAQLALRAVNYDLAILDLGLPDGDGLRLIQALRDSGTSIPVLVVSARDALRDRVLGLDTGADDYIVKPFELSELIARIRALLRRPGRCLGTLLTAGNLALDVASGSLQIAGSPIEITPRELALLEQLLRHVGQVVRKSAIETSLYSLSAEASPNAVEAVVSRLRRRLTQARAQVEIHTAHGIGYMLNVNK